jgi:hypothetical protein
MQTRNIKKNQVPRNQRELILHHLKYTGNATSAEMQQWYGIQDSRKRISELRREGYNIKSREVKFKSKFGYTSKYYVYSIGKPYKKLDKL